MAIMQGKRGKKILARAVGIQKENWGNQALFGAK